MGREGSGVRAASASSIEITFMYRGRRCRERLPLKPTAANLRAAERHRIAILDAIQRGTFHYPTTFPDSPRAREFADHPHGYNTVGDYLKYWLEARKPEVAASTWHGYSKIVYGVLIPQFGHLPLHDLKRGHVRQWASEQSASLKRIRNVVSVLRAAMQQAADDEWIESNPLYGWSPQRREPPRQDYVDPFDAAEQQAIIQSGGGNIVQFGFWTGLRTSELLALRWDDIDWRRCEALIARARTQASGADESPKTAASRRTVRLLRPAMDALRDQLAWTRAQPSGYIWLNPRTGEPWTGDQAFRKRLWVPALRRAGVRYRNPYQMRHTYASMMLSAGEPVMWVAAQLGHSSASLTQRTYARWMPSALPDAGDRAVEQFGQNDSILPTSKKGGT